MPTYTYKNKQTEKIWEEYMSVSAHDTFLEQNPHIETVISAVFLGDPVRQGLKKPDPGFREILKEIKRKNIRSNINTW
jgi:hypothetical protein